MNKFSHFYYTYTIGIIIILLTLMVMFVLPKPLCIPKSWLCNAYKRTMKEMESMVEAIYRFQKYEGRFPTTHEKLSILTRKTYLSEGSPNKYLYNIKNDSWGNPFIYRYEETNSQTFLLYSVGINSKDEFGHGDDIVFNSKHSKHIYCQ